MGPNARVQFKQMLETPQGKTFSTAGLSIVTVIILFFIVMRPATTSITNRLLENDTRREYIAQAKNKKLDLEKLSEQSNKNENNIKLLNKYLPEKPTESFVVGNITAIILNEGLTLMNLRVTPISDIDIGIAVDSSNIKQNSMELVITGDLLKIESFISKLEAMPKSLNIESVSYNSISESETGGWQANIKLIFYFFDINNLFSITNG